MDKLCKIILHLEYASLEQLQQCIETQRKYLEQRRNISVVDILLQNNVLTQDQVYQIQYYLQEEGSTQSQNEEDHCGDLDFTTPTSIGRYQIMEEIGAGGMGRVYRVFDPDLQKEMALKALRAKKESHKTRRFTRETNTLERLSHPNIIKIYDVGQVANISYFTMEYIQGKSLAQILKKEALTLSQTLDYILQIASAIEHAHQHGVIHRDLKPSNIMIDETNIPYVMDFGLSKGLADAKLSQTGIPIGTMLYMPPEQATGKIKEIDKRSDLYSLGIVLFEMLTGQLPFYGDFHEVIMKILEQSPTPPHEIIPNIPEELSKICLKAIAKNKQDRYQTAEQFRQDLQKFCG